VVVRGLVGVALGEDGAGDMRAPVGDGAVAIDDAYVGVMETLLQPGSVYEDFVTHVSSFKDGGTKDGGTLIPRYRGAC
jgi:hypothetical protein